MVMLQKLHFDLKGLYSLLTRRQLTNKAVVFCDIGKGLQGKVGKLNCIVHLYMLYPVWESSSLFLRFVLLLLCKRAVKR